MTFDPKTRIIWTDGPRPDVLPPVPSPPTTRRVRIVIEFDTDADQYSLESLEMEMRVQTESLNDGSISDHFKVEKLDSSIDSNREHSRRCLCTMRESCSVCST